MANNSNRHIREAIETARRLTILADGGEAGSKDDGCRVLFSVVRDCAYRLRAEAEREREAHIARGKWE